MKRSTWGIALALAGLALVVPGSISAASPTGVHHRKDVTTTTEGKKMAREAAGRYGSLGIAARPDDLAVIEDDKGWVIGPKGTEPQIDDATGKVQIVADARPANTASVPETRRVAPLAAPRRGADTGTQLPQATTPQAYWQLTNSHCWSRIYASSGWGYMDTCYKIWKMMQETNGSRDDFLIESYATMTGNSGSGLEWAWIQTTKYGSVAQYWVDWAPDASTSGGCRTVPLGVGMSYAGVGGSISSAFTACEQLDVSKGNPTVTIYEDWDYCQTLCFQGMRGRVPSRPRYGHTSVRTSGRRGV